MYGGNAFRVHVRVICKLQEIIKSQTLTAGSNIDHMTASHDVLHDHQKKIKKNMNGIHHCHDDQGLCPGFRVHI
jgi:hypothetical protein